MTFFYFWFGLSLFCLLNVICFLNVYGREFIRTRGELLIVLIMSVIPLWHIFVALTFFVAYYEEYKNTDSYKSIIKFFEKEL